MEGGRVLSIGQRIKMVRVAKSKTQKSLAEDLGLKQNTVASYEIDRVQPSDRTISDICRIFNVNEDWLRTGEGEMFLPLTRSEKIAKFAGKILRDESPSFQRQLVELLAELDTEEWEMLERFAQKLAKKMD